MVKFIQRHWRLAIASLCALLVLCGLIFLTTNRTLLFYGLTAWIVFIWIYLLLLWFFMLRADAVNIPAYARQHDQSALLILLVFCIGAAASFISVVIFLLHQNLNHPNSHHFSLLFILLSSFSLVGAWLIVPSIFTLHYAHEFYLCQQQLRQKPVLLFPDKLVQPDYLDFAYFAFTIAVAAQTADIAVASAPMRRLVLLQSLLAFIFNASILGLTLNIVAGLL